MRGITQQVNTCFSMQQDGLSTQGRPAAYSRPCKLDGNFRTIMELTEPYQDQASF
jgi:hypothetical protein